MPRSEMARIRSGSFAAIASSFCGSPFNHKVMITDMHPSLSDSPKCCSSMAATSKSSQRPAPVTPALSEISAEQVPGGRRGWPARVVEKVVYMSTFSTTLMGASAPLALPSPHLDAPDVLEHRLKALAVATQVVVFV